jgi:hypothetical protein
MTRFAAGSIQTSADPRAISRVIEGVGASRAVTDLTTDVPEFAREIQILPDVRLGA